ncbi:MAG: hypothetical protein GY760_21660 [Deltaproteobacteria bacterium]|nr:hypothetical protein [Deltaproteobacteria bacterium]
MKFIMILTATEISKAMVDEYISEKNGYWKTCFSFDEAVIGKRSAGEVDIFFSNEVEDEVELEDIDYFRNKFGKEPKTYFHVNIAASEGSMTLAVTITNEIIAKWGGLIHCSSVPSLEDLINADTF